MENAITVVAMERGHIQEIARIEALCFTDPWSERGFIAELTNRTAHFFTAQANGKTVGYIGMYVVCDEGYIVNLAVHPAHRKKGIARTLLHTAEGVAYGMGAKFLSLEVRAGNRAAQRLYRAEGFQTAGRRKDFYARPKEDALLLTLFFDS